MTEGLRRGGDKVQLKMKTGRGVCLVRLTDG